jgi:hypothetical protein
MFCAYHGFLFSGFPGYLMHPEPKIPFFFVMQLDLLIFLVQGESFRLRQGCGGTFRLRQGCGGTGRDGETEEPTGRRGDWVTTSGVLFTSRRWFIQPKKIGYSRFVWNFNNKGQGKIIIY